MTWRRESNGTLLGECCWNSRDQARIKDKISQEAENDWDWEGQGHRLLLAKGQRQ